MVPSQVRTFNSETAIRLCTGLVPAPPVPLKLKKFGSNWTGKSVYGADMQCLDPNRASILAWTPKSLGKKADEKTVGGLVNADFCTFFQIL